MKERISYEKKSRSTSESSNLGILNVLVSVWKAFCSCITFLVKALILLLVIIKTISMAASLKPVHATPDEPTPAPSAVAVVQTPAPEPTPEPTRVPKKTYLTSLDPMEMTVPVHQGSYTSTRGVTYDHGFYTLSGAEDAYMVYSLNKEYTELSGTVCALKGNALDDVVSVSFYSVDTSGVTYSLPAVCEGEEFYTLEVNGYQSREFTVDLTDVDILRIDLKGYDPSWAHLSGVVLGDPVLK